MSAAQNLFAGGRTLAELRRAGAAGRIATLSVRLAKAQAMFAVITAYYDTVLGQRFVEIAEAALQQARDTLAQIRLGRELGEQAEFEVVRAEVALEQSRALLVEARSDHLLSHARLRQLLALPRDRVLVLTSALADGQLGTPRIGIGERSRRPRVAVRSARAAVDLQDAAVDVARSAYFPSVALFADYTRVAYPEDLWPSFGEFRTNFAVGGAVEFSLFEGFRTRGAVQWAEAGRAQARAELSRTERAAEYEATEAALALRSARASWQANAVAVTQAQKAYQIALVRYREGISTQLELNDARLVLARARAERARAARDYYVTHMRLELLPELPVAVRRGWCRWQRVRRSRLRMPWRYRRAPHPTCRRPPRGRGPPRCGR